MAAGDLGGVDRMVEMGVADEDARRPAPAPQEAVESGALRQVRAAQEEVAERHPREVGVDEERLPLVGEAVAGYPEPFDLQPGRQLEWPGLQLGEGLPVVAFSGAPRRPGACQLTQVS